MLSYFIWCKIANMYQWNWVKCIQTRTFFWSVFSRIRTEYEEIRSISPYSVRMREYTDQKKLRIRTLFTQCWIEESWVNHQKLGYFYNKHNCALFVVARRYTIEELSWKISRNSQENTYDKVILMKIPDLQPADL